MSHASFSGHTSTVSSTLGRHGWVPIYEVKIVTQRVDDWNTGHRNRVGLIVIKFVKFFDPLSAKLLAMRDSGELFETVSIESDTGPEWGNQNAVKTGQYLRKVKVTGWVGASLDGKPAEIVTLEANSWGELVPVRVQEYQAGESTSGVMRRGENKSVYKSRL